MSNKIPCGGFKLDNNFLGMNENDELSLTSGSEGEGKAYKQLVTDGTGIAKWEDRLAYEDVTNTVILEEQNFTFSEQGNLMVAIISKGLGVAYGEIVAVSWDGVLYNCTVEDLGGRVVLGNLGLSPGISNVDTGEPFIIMSDGSSTQVGTSDTSTEHVLSISRKNMVMKKIEPKYMGLFVFPIYSDDKSGVSTSVSYDDVRAAFDAKIPIFAQKIYTISGLYVDQYEFCKAISHADDRLEFRFDSKIVKYLNDGTITEEVKPS